MNQFNFLFQLIFFFISINFIQTNLFVDLNENKTNICQFNYQGNILSEGQSIEINGKIHKIENCLLHRAFHVCGRHLFNVLNILCQALHLPTTKTKQKRFRRFLRQKSLTEACCQTVCTIHEMSRYCP